MGFRTRFNSIKVQLERLALSFLTRPTVRFNSIKVQLERASKKLQNFVKF